MYSRPSLNNSSWLEFTHAGAVLINFCKDIEQGIWCCTCTQSSNAPQSHRRQRKPSKRYLQDQSITTLAMVADNVATFAKVNFELLASTTSLIVDDRFVIALLNHDAVVIERATKRERST